MFKKAVIVVNGDKSNIAAIKKYIDKKTLLVGADAGAKRLRASGFVPHVVIGDLDSLSKTVQKRLEKTGVTFVTYPQEKDETDTELALLYCVENGVKEIIIAGLLGTRIDHMQATIQLLLHKKFSGVNLRIIEGKQEIFLVRDTVVLRGKRGNVLSLIPLQKDAAGITTKGLKYTLVNETLYLGSTRGISNELTGVRAKITLKKGVLLVILRRGGDSNSRSRKTR